MTFNETRNWSDSDAQAVELVHGMVAITSLSGEEKNAANYLADWLVERGVEAYIDHVGNVVGTKGDGPKEILMLGHLDTFPGELPVKIKGGWLYGRGSVDAKGPLSTFAMALVNADVPSGYKVTVVGVVEEETATSLGARHWYTSNDEPYCCIIGEPSSSDRITVGYKGLLLAEVGINIPYGHSAGEAALPAEVGIESWQGIRDHFEAMNTNGDGSFKKITTSLRHINSSAEDISGTVNLVVGLRLPQWMSANKAHLELEKVLVGLGNAWTMNVSARENAYRSQKNTPLVRALLAGIRSTGHDPRFVVKTGTSDMNVLGAVWSCPIVAYGPGDSSLDHTPDERLNLSEYLDTIKVLGTSLEQLLV